MLLPTTLQPYNTRTCSSRSAIFAASCCALVLADATCSRSCCWLASSCVLSCRKNSHSRLSSALAALASACVYKRYVCGGMCASPHIQSSCMYVHMCMSSHTYATTTPLYLPHTNFFSAFFRSSSCRCAVACSVCASVIALVKSACAPAACCSTPDNARVNILYCWWV